MINSLLIRGMVRNPDRHFMQWYLLLILAGLILGMSWGKSVFGAMFFLVPVIFIFGTALGVFAGFFQWHRNRASAIHGLLVTFSILLLGWFGFFHEPQRLQITRVKIVTPKVTRPHRFAFIADLQIDQLTEYERRVIALAYGETPDAVLWGGDYLQASSENANFELMKELKTYLGEIRLSASPTRTIAVAGNLEALMGRSLQPEHSFLPEIATFTQRCEIGETLVTALDWPKSFNHQLVIPAESRFHVVLGHHPDYALGKPEADLLLAGHTHGGQIVIPGFGPLLTASRIPRAWTSGVTRISDGTYLLVSRGIGMERIAPEIRFFCPPELIFLEIVPGTSLQVSRTMTGG